MWVKAFVFLMYLCLISLPSKAAAIHDAASKDDVAAIAVALDFGENVNEIYRGVTPLYISATKGNVEAVQLLIKHGADVNLPTSFGVPLSAAAQFGHTEIMALLLAQGANPNAATNSMTALHAAAHNGCLACVKLLVDAGSDVNALTPNREPAIHFAKKNGHSEVADYLFKHGYITPVPPPISGKLQSASSSRGEALFSKQCRGCHDASRRMKNFEGPALWGIVGRPKASIENFRYSKSLKEVGGSWNYEELNGFISDPRRFLPGTAMNGAGYQNLEDRADLMVYLRSLNEKPVELPKQ